MARLYSVYECDSCAIQEKDNEAKDWRSVTISPTNWRDGNAEDDDLYRDYTFCGDCAKRVTLPNGAHVS